jgi:hypothetical protein
MRTQGLIGALAGLTGALLYLAGSGAAATAPLLMGLGPFPFFIAVLGWGNLAGLAAAASALLSVYLFIMLSTGGFAFALTSMLAFAMSAIAPALWLSHLALLRRHTVTSDPSSPVEWYPLGRLLLWLAGIACAGYLALELLAYALTGAGLPAAIARTLDLNFSPELRQALLTRIHAPSWEALLDLLAHILPATGGVFWQIWLASNGIGAYALLTATGRCPRPEAGWRALALPRLYAAPFLATVAVSFIGGELGWIATTIASLLFVPYFFLGLAVVHAIPLTGPGRYALLGLFYFLLLFLAWPAIPVGLLGLWEQWFGLRAKIGRSGREDK